MLVIKYTAAMSGSQTVEVKTYSSVHALGVKLAHPSTSKQAKATIAKQLGLKPQSIALFGLFIGPLDRPSKMLKDTDKVPVAGGDFSFHRWCFNPALEAKLCRQDEVAMHLMFCEAKFNYDQRTQINPSPEQVLELESFLDPVFTVERQFVEMMRTVPGYFTYIVHECTTKEDIVGNACNIPKGTPVQCYLDTETLSIRDKGGELLVEWDWKIVRRWKMDSVSTIMFDVCLKDGNAPIMRWISLESRQSNYLFNLASDICDAIIESEADQRPAINPALAGRVQDPLKEFVNGIFHGSAPKFSSIH